MSLLIIIKCHIVDLFPSKMSSQVKCYFYNLIEQFTEFALNVSEEKQN